jgi:hypothetical protein
MEKKDLTKLLDEVFIPLGFKRKGNNWVHNGDVLTKILNLQKSNYGNAFYINYGYIIKGLELTTKMHVYMRLASNDKGENLRITNLLNLESDLDVVERLSDLKRFINDQIVLDFNMTHTEHDIINELKQRPDLNNIPLVVKRYFGLPE